MKVSIITVVWNNKYTVKDAIESILNQTYPNIEHVIIDGGSTDGTMDIIDSYRDKIGKVISEKDNGLYDAMNKGLRLASGDIIGILNSDDVYFDEKVIAKVCQTFLSSKVDSVYGDLQYVKKHDLTDVVRYWKSSAFKKNSFSKGWHPPHPTFFAKKEVYEKYGGFDLDMKVSADFELMLRFLETNNISTAYFPEVIVKMRVGGESNKSIMNIITGNKSILKAFDKNGVKLNKLMYIYNRMLPKIIQIIKRGR